MVSSSLYLENWILRRSGGYFQENLLPCGLATSYGSLFRWPCRIFGDVLSRLWCLEIMVSLVLPSPRALSSPRHVVVLRATPVDQAVVTPVSSGVHELLQRWFEL
ncbi:hypothetical protein NL676_017690 [Syzygium grande]|nr:hypothetical protein NL676_017690 [Syzygium grande]